MDDSFALHALSPLDGRYASLTQPLRPFFSEAAFIRYRLKLEIDYLVALSHHHLIRPLTPKEIRLLNQLSQNHSSPSAIKTLEASTRHDVKAIEYYLRNQLASTSLADLIPYLHFGLTSEDVNHLAYRLMLGDAQAQVIFPIFISLLKSLRSLINSTATLPMLARTHGQAAVPTTLGKELAVFASRLLGQLKLLTTTPLTGKLAGAVGNYQAQTLAFPKVNWPQFARQFLRQYHLTPTPICTQINPPEDTLTLLHTYFRLNSILLNLCQDLWRYISDDWLSQTGKTKFVGSSTMPQKINPIEFENAEGNLTLANGLINTLAQKLPLSRLQRDLSDSTIMRQLGVIFGHQLIAYRTLIAGLNHLTPNQAQIQTDLNHNYAILAEALQTQLRVQGQADAYETVAAKFKHLQLTPSAWKDLVRPLAPNLASLTPATYLGYATQLAHRTVTQLTRFINQLKRCL